MSDAHAAVRAEIAELGRKLIAVDRLLAAAKRARDFIASEAKARKAAQASTGVAVIATALAVELTAAIDIAEEALSTRKEST
jgi:hypothetical protein